MCEWLLARLLRFYPREFQRAYGVDALQLIRDRSRDERSVLLQLRLSLDIIADLLAVSLRNLSPAKPLVIGDNTSTGPTPSLLLHQSSRPRPAALAAGVVTATVMFAVFTQMFDPRAPDLQARLLIPYLFQTSPAQSHGFATPSLDVNSADRQKLIETVAAKLEQHYSDAAIGRRLSEALLEHHRKGDYDALVPGPDFVARVNAHIQDASRALGIPVGTFVADVVYSAQPIPQGPPPLSAEALERNRSRVLQQNCLFEKIEMLPHHIGYLKLNGFPDASVCRSITDAAMQKMDNAAALILDLRDNPGGFGSTALQIARVPVRSTDISVRSTREHAALLDHHAGGRQQTLR